MGYPATRKDEETGVDITERVYMCSDLWDTRFAYENAKFLNQNRAALESLRNHVSEGNAAIGSLVFEANKRLSHDH